MHYPMRPFNSAETNASHYVAHLVREYPTLSLDDLTRKALAANPYKTEKTRSIFEKMVFSCVRKEENKRVPAEPVTQAVVEPVVEQLPPPRVQHVVTYWEGDSTKTIATMAASFDEARDNFLVGYPTLTIIKIECPLNPVYDETPAHSDPVECGMLYASSLLSGAQTQETLDAIFSQASEANPYTTVEER